MRSGQRVGKYVLGEQIARGGMAEVWAARVEGPGGFVKSLALKFILESFAGDPELERLFLNEARVAAKLQHANLVGVFDFDKVPDAEAGGTDRYFIAMERVDGHDLRRVVQVARHNGRRLPPSVALYVAGEVLKGLRYVHERTDDSGRNRLHLVHRDVSPHNVLVGMGGEVKLSDFGIAKAMTQSLGTQAGTVRGKLAYASPEQLRGEPADHRADQFGLGVTLWEMLADRRLFQGADEVEIVGKVLRCEIPSLPAEAGIDATVESVVRRMLAAEPGHRFPSTAEALSAVLAAPGYASDAADLSALMQDLFAPRLVTVPPTVPMHVDGPVRPGALAETSQMERGASESPSLRVTGSDPDARASNGTGDLGTGSGYVSSAGTAIPTWIAEPQSSTRPGRWVWGAVGVAVVVATGIALGTRQGHKVPAQDTRTSTDAPRPTTIVTVHRAAGEVPAHDDRSRPSLAPAATTVVAPPATDAAVTRSPATEMVAAPSPALEAVAARSPATETVAAPSPAREAAPSLPATTPSPVWSAPMPAVAPSAPAAIPDQGKETPASAPPVEPGAAPRGQDLEASAARSGKKRGRPVDKEAAGAASSGPAPIAAPIAAPTDRKPRRPSDANRTGSQGPGSPANASPVLE